jgi:hypothetical protein
MEQTISTADVIVMVTETAHEMAGIGDSAHALFWLLSLATQAAAAASGC